MEITSYIPMVVVVLFIGFMIYQMTRKEKDGGSKESELPDLLPEKPPTKLKGASFNYFPFKRGRSYWVPLVDMLAGYKFNHTRIITFGDDASDWKADQADWWYWKGGMKDSPSNLDDDKVAEIIYFLKYCASKGIVVHVDFILAQNKLYWDDLMKYLKDGNANRPIVQSIGKLARKLQDAMNGKVIFGMGNEVGDEEPYNKIQEAVWKIIHNPEFTSGLPKWTAAWHTHAMPATYITMHELCDGHCHNGVASTDNPSVLKYAIHRSKDKIKEMMSQVVKCSAEHEGYELLLMYVKNGDGEKSVFTKDEIIKEWGNILEHNKNL